jgi:hypothetical protein
MMLTTGMLMFGKISVGVRTIASIPIMRISMAITTKVYGRRNASRTIHIEFRSFSQLPTDGRQFAVRDLVYPQVRSLRPGCKSSWPMPAQNPVVRETVLHRDIVPCSARQSLMLVAYFLATTGEAV